MRVWTASPALAASSCLVAPTVVGEQAEQADELGDAGEDAGEPDLPASNDLPDAQDCRAEPALLPGPPFDPALCGSWAIEPPAPHQPAPPPACAGASCPVFVDVTASAGLDYAQFLATAPSESTCVFDLANTPNADCEPQWASGGVAVGDSDGDGWPDLFVTRLAAPSLLLRNRGDGTFVDVAAAVGLGDCTFGNGPAWADIDDDGDLDLALTSLGGARHHLYVNEGGCFVDEAEARGFALPVAGRHVGMSVVFGDYDLDGVLDAHVHEWIDDAWWDERGAWGSRLLHGLGGGAFEDVTLAAGVSLADIVFAKPGAWGFASSFVDLDGDALPDLAVTADFGEARMFWNAGDGTFVDGTDAAEVASEGNAMGLALGDYDGDGRLDWFVSAIAEASPKGEALEHWRGTGHRLYRNLGGRVFADVTDYAGVRDDQAWGWGAVPIDIDHDGDLDLALATGWPGRGVYGTFVHLDSPMRLWVNQGEGRFEEQGALRGVDDRGQGRGLVTLDYDRDGDLDLFVANHAGRPALLRNDGADAIPWLIVEAEGTHSNRGSLGAIVTVQVEAGGPVQVRQLGVGGHFLGMSEPIAHFGLGAATQSVHELRVRWPASGAELVMHDVAPSQRIRVIEP